MMKKREVLTVENPAYNSSVEGSLTKEEIFKEEVMLEEGMKLASRS